jgi:hypothetical protein
MAAGNTFTDRDGQEYEVVWSGEDNLSSSEATTASALIARLATIEDDDAQMRIDRAKKARAAVKRPFGQSSADATDDVLAA